MDKKNISSRFEKRKEKKRQQKLVTYLLRVKVINDVEFGKYANP